MYKTIFWVKKNWHWKDELSYKSIWLRKKWSTQKGVFGFMTFMKSQKTPDLIPNWNFLAKNCGTRASHSHPESFVGFCRQTTRHLARKRKTGTGTQTRRGLGHRLWPIRNKSRSQPTSDHHRPRNGNGWTQYAIGRSVASIPSAQGIRM